MLDPKFSGVIRTRREWRDPSGQMRTSEVEENTYGDLVFARKIDAGQITPEAQRISAGVLPPPRVPARVLKYPWLRWLYNLITKEVS